jgi:hypothetical protein
MTSPPNRPLILHSSLRGLLAAVATPLALAGLGLRSLTVAGPNPGAIGLVVVASVLAVGGALFLPRRVEFDRTGVLRVFLARRQHLPWDAVVALERSRPSTPPSPLRPTGTVPAPRVTGGLVARGGRHRRWMLTDRVESQVEYEQLAALVGSLGAPVRLRAPRPADDALPTSLYRRRGS